ncbi:MAG: 4Fe-4S dicluster domain-containing protein [Bacteroidales bacterium]|nr:4Fe-4S dicluster domain-containing protein [Bacteroidales bacterium]
MNIFGFSVNKSREINYDNNDRALYYYLIRVEPTTTLCIACGACSATCPSGINSGLNFHKIMLYVRRGENVQIAKEINKCFLCGKCQLTCPRNVNTRNVILNILSFLKVSSI